jgi:creatinine amidohydrolase
LQFVELTAPQIRALAPDTPIVFPIAAIEQHGPHLPVWTDSLILGRILETVSSALDDEVLFAPLMWLGNSDHHMDFAGTLSARPRTYLDLINQLIDNAVSQGFRRIVLINGHGGNDIPGKQATFEARMRYTERQDLLLLMGTYWGMGVEPWQVDPSLVQQEMGHACEWETSMVMAIRPDLVGEYASLPAVDHGNPFRPATRAWKTADRSAAGYIGVPSQGSEAKGHLLLSQFAGGVTEFLRRVVAWDGASWDG